ncbi:HD domain-containing protein [Holzapfeliella floricola]|nr:HD domain-containing protein [Holzapfeliella floricola]
MKSIQKLPREKVLRDPVHNYIHVEYPFILELIDTREFQRLRRIRQLGGAAFTFHGGEHSRFTHSLGVYEVTRQIVNNFNRNYPSKEAGDGLWDDSESIVALAAALLHDVGHGAYSHTFEHIFHTDHEQFTQEIITSEKTEINQVLKKVSLDFPEKVASVINKTYPNPQVVQMISSQIDADRMDYLLRDAYMTGTQYGMFDLTRILRVMRPYSGGITFEKNGMHAVEDYILSRFQMYQQVYFHPASRGMEVVLTHLLERAKYVYEQGELPKNSMSNLLAPFLEHNFTLEDYLNLDDGVLNANFSLLRYHHDKILSDLAGKFLDRKPFKSVQITDESKPQIQYLKTLVEKVGFDSDYYTALNDSFDLPYDAYHPDQKKPKTQIEIMISDSNWMELSKLSKIVEAISGKQEGDERFYFPRVMIKGNSQDPELQELYAEFQSYIKNGELLSQREEA